MTWCHHYQITLKARHIPGCLNVMANFLSRSNEVQSTEWSLHSQVFKQLCHKWLTPHVDLFATRLNHKVPLYVSSVPDQNAWDIDAGRVSLLMLTLPRPGMPWFYDLVQPSTEIPLHQPVSRTLLKQCFTAIHNISTSMSGV